MQHNLGDFTEAIRLLERAVAIRRTLPDRALLADTLLQLSWVYRSRGDGGYAHRIVQEVLDIRRSVFPADAPEIAEAVYELGFVAANNEELEVRYREALAILERTGARPEQQLRLRHGLTTSLRRQGRFAEALEQDRQALDFATREFGPEHFRVGHALVHLADQVRDLENDAAGRRAAVSPRSRSHCSASAGRTTSSWCIRSTAWRRWRAAAAITSRPNGCIARSFGSAAAPKESGTPSSC